MNPATFPYVQRQAIDLAPRPMLPIRLERDQRVIDVSGLVDSGAMLSVLPDQVGAAFGVEWASLPDAPLGGIARGLPAKFLAVRGTVASFPTVDLLFAWAKSDDLPLILGYYNFFRVFDVCFRARQNLFDIRPRTP